MTQKESTKRIDRVAPKRVNLREARRSKGFTNPDALAMSLGVSSSAIQTWERTNRLPKNPKTRAAYLAALGLPVSAK